ncbi:MAG TPA: SpoIVB peptidase S55 domain-containing protein, partial [Rugosimonospora sp.]|nr:SpoIVB peptidase S55 domain-containing protein [Rugosimonospora sp.]
MLTVQPDSSKPCRYLLFAFLAFTFALCLGSQAASAQELREILPLSQVRPGMQGYAYTIFAGDQVEKFDLEVIGVLDNFLGPKQSIILVQLKGPKVEHTGVVAGMSGSPVYLDGKLAGALSLKLGIFTKEPIAGVTPIQDVLNAPSQPAAAQTAAEQLSLPSEAATRTGLPSGSALEPIETPLVFSGFQPAALQQFATQIQSYGFVAAQGGTTAPRPDDAHLVAGEMAGMVFVQGDASINSACTVTAVQADRVYLCGHP